MPRPIWNGSISFGLLQVPVQLYSGERSTHVPFRLLDGRDKNPIRYERVNSETGEEVPWKDVVKAYEYAKGNFVVIDEEEIRKAAPESTETVEIEAFVDREDIDPRFFEKPYYLVPGERAEKGYVLLREILKRKKKVGIARVVIRTRQYLAALMPCGDALVLDLMRFPEEVVDPAEFQLPAGAPGKFRISAKELDMGEQLIESMTSEWDADDYHDDFREKMRKLIDVQIARQKGKKVKAPAAAEPRGVPAGNVIDLTALLRKSLAGQGRTRTPRQRKSRKKTG